MNALKDELAQVLNRHSAENESGTPDFILAEFLRLSLVAFDEAVVLRERWYGRDPNELNTGVRMNAGRAPSEPKRARNGETDPHW